MDLLLLRRLFFSVEQVVNLFLALLPLVFIFSSCFSSAGASESLCLLGWRVGIDNSGIKSNGEKQNRMRICCEDTVWRTKWGVYREQWIRKGFAPLAFTPAGFLCYLSFARSKETPMTIKKISTHKDMIISHYILSFGPPKERIKEKLSGSSESTDF